MVGTFHTVLLECQYGNDQAIWHCFIWVDVSYNWVQCLILADLPLNWTLESMKVHSLWSRMRSGKVLVNMYRSVQKYISLNLYISCQCPNISKRTFPIIAHALSTTQTCSFQQNKFIGFKWFHKCTELFNMSFKTLKLSK